MLRFGAFVGSSLLLLCDVAFAQSTTRASVATSGVAGNSLSHAPQISADGRFVAFESYGTNLVPGDGNGRADVFVHDRWYGTTELVSVDSSGAQGDADSVAPRVSADGRFVCFQSAASNLVPGDTNARAWTSSCATGPAERPNASASRRAAWRPITTA